MPLKIVRNDITKLKADAIVNSANPLPQVGSGVDSSIYAAAGYAELLLERARIGAIACGDAAVTPAFALPAKYIFHTVAPRWLDGLHGEEQALLSCYRRVLQLAVGHGCASIAIPLLATGNYRFPRGKALELARRAISAFLQQEDVELLVYLVVYDKASFTLAEALCEDIEAYIDDYYVESFPHAPGKTRAARRAARPEGVLCDCLKAEPVAEEKILYSVIPVKNWPEFAQELAEESFSEKLFRMIDARHLSDVEVYKNANLDRKLFSKLRRKSYKPSKKTVLALAISLRLNLDEALDLLRYAGFALAPNDKQDVVVRYCLERKIYDIFEVNALLFQYADTSF